MAQGFKVADAYVEIHTEDDTKQGRDKIKRDTTSWANKLGGGIGRSLLRGLMRAFRLGLSGVTALFGAALKSMLALVKFGAIAGVVATAIAGLASAVVALLPLLAELISALVSAAGALLLWPAAIATVVASVLTIKLALKGVGEAFKALASGDMAAFEEALKKLAPEAQKFLRVVKELQPAWDRLRLGLQNRLFSNLAHLTRQLARLWFPSLEQSLGKIAAALNGGIREGIQFLLDLESRSTIVAMLSNIADVITNVSRALRPLLSIFADVLEVSTGVLAQLTGGLASIFQRWADIISVMREDGSLAQVILDGVVAVKQLFGLLTDLWGILKGILNASGASGGLFAFFDRLNKLINSASGQKALQDFFTAMAALGETLAPVFTTLLLLLVPVAQGIAEIAEAFTPSLIVALQGLGEALVNLVPGIKALAPLFAVLGAILPGIGTAISNLLIAFTPGFVEGVAALGGALLIIGEAAAPLGKSLGAVAAALGRALIPLASILVDLLIGLTPGVVAFLNGLAEGLKPLAEVAPIVAKGLSDLLVAVAPLLPVLGEVLALLLVTIAGGLTQLLLVITPSIKMFADLAAKGLGRLMPILLQAATRTFPALAEAGARIAEAFTPLIPVLTEVFTLFVDRLAAFLSGPEGQRTMESLGELAAVMVRVAVAMTENLLLALQIILPYLPALLDAVIQLAPAATEFMLALLPLLPVILRLGTVLLTVLRESGALDAIIGLLITGIIWIGYVFRAWAAVIQWVIGIVRELWRRVSDVANVIRTAGDRISQFFGGLRGTITRLFSSAGDWLIQAGRNIIDGLIRGIRGAVGGLGNVLSEVAGLVRDYWPFSPAKRGPLSGRGDLLYAGREIPRRLAAGVEQSKDALLAAMAGLAGLARMPGVSPLGLAAAATAGGLVGTAPGAGGSGPNTERIAMVATTVRPQIVVQIGQKVLDDAVLDVVVANPREVAAASDEGSRQRGFSNPRRR